MQEEVLLKPNNLLVEAAMPLLGLMVVLNRVEAVENLESFRLKVLEEIRFFEARIKEDIYNKRTILAARYCLCTALDECIFETTRGKQSVWLYQSLLTTLYQESHGGERFYIILNTVLENPQENLDLLELMYYILSLGFKGKFYQDEIKLETIRQHLFRSLVGFKFEAKNLLQNAGKSLKPKTAPHFPLLTMIVLIGSLLLAISLHLKSYSKNYAMKVFTMVNKIPHQSGREEFDETRN